MTCIRRALRIDPDTVRTVRDHLDSHVSPHLAPDVSSYARGRRRAWLQIEAPLGPTQPWRPGLASHRLWPWLVAIWQRIDPRTCPAVGIAIQGDTGIAWHRDASYAQVRAVLVNLEPCAFEIDRDRDSPNGRPGDPLSLDLQGGEVLAFDCKHQHRVVDPDPSRWSIVLWRLKRHPNTPLPATRIP